MRLRARFWSERLVNAWYNDPFDSLAILLPPFAIFFGAALLIPPAAMNQKHRHKDGVCPWENIGEAAYCTHGVGKDEIAQVVNVSSITPPPRAKKEAVVLETVSGEILNMHDLGLFAPEHTVALSTADKVFLMVDAAEENVAAHASPEDREGVKG